MEDSLDTVTDPSLSNPIVQQESVKVSPFRQQQQLNSTSTEGKKRREKEGVEKMLPLKVARMQSRSLQTLNEPENVRNFFVFLKM